MDTQHVRCFVALAETGDAAVAAQVCGLAPGRLAEALAALTAQFGAPLLNAGPGLAQLTPLGERVLVWARGHLAECDQLGADLHELRRSTALASLLSRRSVSPKRLAAPGPDARELDAIIQAALSAPDHGGLHPWRVIEFHGGERAALAELFEQEKLRRDPLAGAQDLERAREHATRPPVLLAFIVSPRSGERIPLREQWLAAGAALSNLLNATHQLGFGAIVLSGDRCFDPVLCAALGLLPEESLAGFVSMGRIVKAPPARVPIASGDVLGRWHPRPGERETGTGTVTETESDTRTEPLLRDGRPDAAD